MSGLGDAIGAALGGIGAGVAAISNKYLDEEMQQQRAQALADIQFANMKRTEQWQQSDEVQGQRMVNQRRELAMRNEEGLKGKVAEATNPELRQSKIDNEVAYLQGTTPAKIAAENAMTEGTAGTKLDAVRMQRLVLDPMDVAKSGAIANAHYAAKELHDPKSAFERLPEAKKLEVQNIASELKDINKQMTKEQADGGWDPSKNAGHKQLELAKVALQQRLTGILTGQDGADVLGIFGGASRGADARDKPPTLEPKQEQKGPSLADRISKWVASQRGAAEQQGLEYQQLQRRVQEARNGGAPLSIQEREVARKYGIDAGGN